MKRVQVGSSFDRHREALGHFEFVRDWLFAEKARRLRARGAPRSTDERGLRSLHIEWRVCVLESPQDLYFFGRGVAT